MGHDIYRATNFEILPLNPNISIENPPHIVESNFLALVRSHFQHGNFLFSYTWDLTTRLQVQSQRASGSEKSALWQLVSIILPIRILLLKRDTRQTTASSGISSFRLGLSSLPPRPTKLPL